VVKGFFFDAVDTLSDELSIGMSIEDAPSVFPDVADAGFSIGDQTMVAAQEAGDLIVFLFLIKHRFFEHRFSPVESLKGEISSGRRRSTSNLKKTKDYDSDTQHCGSSAKRSGFPWVEE
jgi:hypothetical protein